MSHDTSSTYMSYLILYDTRSGLLMCQVNRHFNTNDIFLTTMTYYKSFQMSRTNCKEKFIRNQIQNLSIY